MLIINTTVIDNDFIDLDENGASKIFVGEEGFVGVRNSSCIVGASDNLRAVIAGTLVASNTGVAFGLSFENTGGYRVKILDSGQIYSGYGGVTLYGTQSSVENAGLIEADQFSAVVISSYAVGTVSTVTNSGTITGGDEGAGVYFGGMEEGKLVNTGTISGGSSAFNSVNSSADMVVINKGTMVNGVLFGAGNDTYNGIGGKVVDGGISGGVGNDKLIGGSASETFVFGTGGDKDTISNFKPAGKSHDILDFSDWEKIQNFGAVRSHASQHGDDLWIAGGSGDILILNHTHSSDLTRSDFIF